MEKVTEEQSNNAKTDVNGSAKGGLRKIKDVEQPCLHPEHNPPMHNNLADGVYEYTCPSCSKVTIVIVPLITS